MWCFIRLAWPLWSVIAVVGFAYVEGKLTSRRPAGLSRGLAELAASLAAFLILVTIVMWMLPYPC